MIVYLFKAISIIHYSLVFCGKNTQCDKPLKVFAKPGSGEQMIPGLCESVSRVTYGLST